MQRARGFRARVFIPMVPTPNSNPPPPPDLSRQLRLYKGLAAGLVVLLLLGGGFFWFLRHQGQPVTILIDGKPLATVRNAATANTLLRAAEQAKMGPAFADQEPLRMQKVRLVRAEASAAQDPDAVAQAKIRKALTLHLKAFVILVKGKPSVALPTAEDATRALNLVKDHWAEMPPAAEVVGSPEIAESVTIDKRTVDTSLIRQTPEDAASYFWTPPPGKTYTVARGDLGSRIAARNHISLGELITANPSKNLNRLRPGDTLNVRKMPRLLTVRVRKQMVKTEKVHPGAPADEAGLQQVTYLITYRNGQEVSREAKDVVIEERPKVQMDL